MEIYEARTHGLADHISARQFEGIDEAVDMVGLEVREFFSAELGPGQINQRLTDWNRVNRELCSREFSAASQGRNEGQTEGRYRVEINAQPRILALNAVRRGVKRVMIETQKQAEQENFKKLLQAKAS